MKFKSATSFTNQKFAQDLENEILLLCSEFIKNSIHGLKSFLCCYLLIDNATLMNVSSWKLFKMIEKEVEYMVLILNMQI